MNSCPTFSSSVIEASVVSTHSSPDVEVGPAWASGVRTANVERTRATTARTTPAILWRDESSIPSCMGSSSRVRTVAVTQLRQTLLPREFPTNRGSRSMAGREEGVVQRHRPAPPRGEPWCGLRLAGRTEQPGLVGDPGGHQPVADAELAVDVLEVLVDGAR